MASDNDPKLQELVADLARKPGHSVVDKRLNTILTGFLDVEPNAIDWEKRLEIGRMDALLGRTVIEIKSNLDTEEKKAKEQLLGYLQEQESKGSSVFTGIITDGALFKSYTREIDKDGKDSLEKSDEYKTDLNAPNELLIWLRKNLLLGNKLAPNADNIEDKLGRDSLLYRNSQKVIKKLWEYLDNKGDTESATKYKEWNRLLDTAYLNEIEGYNLFFQHTYLTFIAKAIATIALLKKLPKDAKGFLSGQEFQNDGIFGAIESDFFDWVLLHDDGKDLILNIAEQVQQFEWKELEVDILKVLYENLIDPDQRRTLGEYYTPDWLAEKICIKVITEPLNMRVIDPACGSGTFLFHAIRLGIKEANEKNISKSDTIRKITENIVGIDVHPVAVIFARTTYLLAMLPLFQGADAAKGDFSVPVYLGNSLQWDIKRNIGRGKANEDLEIIVPALEDIKSSDNNKYGRVDLRFPAGIAKDKNLFDNVIKQMTELSDEEVSDEAFVRILETQKIEESYLPTLQQTYKDLSLLKSQNRNDIWGYVARNLARPLWLSSDSQKADVVIGNPPWQAYGKMGKAKVKFKEKMKNMELWSKKPSVATTHDLSCYCFARFIELYMKQDGKIAVVMPLSVLTRQHSKDFRIGKFRQEDGTSHFFEFTEAWALDSDLRPLFPLPACVLFAQNTNKQTPMKPPEKMKFISGKLSMRNLELEEAKKMLKEENKAWLSDEEIRSKYGHRFRKGASFSPIRFIFVEKVLDGMRENVLNPLVIGKIGSRDKSPWNEIQPPKGNVENKFLYSIYKTESITPFRNVEPQKGVVSWEKEHSILMNSRIARLEGYLNLSKWLVQVEKKWAEKRGRKISFGEQLDHFGKLSKQFPIKKIRVVYPASGTHLAATIIENEEALIDASLYWAEFDTLEEAYYLVAILNSRTTRDAAKKWQSRGQGGGIDWDRIIFYLPIPDFDKKNISHKELVNLARRAQKVSQNLDLIENENYVNLRRRTRNALIEDGVADEIDALVAKLLKLKV